MPSSNSGSIIPKNSPEWQMGNTKMNKQDLEIGFFSSSNFQKPALKQFVFFSVPSAALCVLCAFRGPPRLCVKKNITSPALNLSLPREQLHGNAKSIAIIER